MSLSGISAGMGGISPVARPGGVDVRGLDALQSGSDQPFSALMNNILTDVSASQHQMDADVARLASGEANNVHEIVLNVAQADIMFRMVMEVRDRLIASYQDVMRMQI